VLAELYMAGVDPDWDKLYVQGTRRRVALPTYPFQRKRYWHAGSFRKRVASLPRRERERHTPPVVPGPSPRPGDRESVHATLASIVARTLGREEVPPDVANLVDAGIDSLRVIELLGNIARTFAVRLAPSDFNAAPTLAALAERILVAASKPANGAGGPRIVTIREGSAGTPVVCFHPAGGHVTGYMGLRGLVPGRHSIFAVQSRAVASGEPEFGTVEQMAEAYVERLASLGCGSVRLFGWSLGGVIAHEVAAVLEQQGVTVTGVGMVDPPEPGANLDVGESMLAVTGIVYDHNPAAPALGELRKLVAELDRSERPTREWLAQCEARGLLPAGSVTAEEFERAWTLYRAHARLTAPFVPRSIRAPVQLWWASRRERSSWPGSTSGEVRERLIGGSHYTIMRMPWVQPIAESLQSPE
jgi:thioesterase domain-containing protein/acyl carrier protein